MNNIRLARILILVGCLHGPVFAAGGPEEGVEPAYQVHPIGWVRKAHGRTTIEVNERYLPALLGVDQLDSILQVHPRRNPENPLRGVFATRAPVRPNLIALSRCRVLSVRGNVVEIDDIDAFADTPVLDIKP